jgi:hypothetical protein
MRGAIEDDNIAILSAQLDDMRKEGAPTSSEYLDTTITVEPITDTRCSTYLDYEPIHPSTYMTSPHLDEVPNA